MKRLALITVLICLILSHGGISYGTIIDSGPVLGVQTFLDTVTDTQWVNVAFGYNKTPLEMLSLLPSGFQLASPYEVSILMDNLPVSTLVDAIYQANLMGSLIGHTYWLGGITSDVGENPGDYFAIGSEFEPDTFQRVAGSSAIYSCQPESASPYLGIWATYTPPPSNPVPEPSTIIQLGAGIAGLFGLRKLRIY